MESTNTNFTSSSGLYSASEDGLNIHKASRLGKLADIETILSTNPNTVNEKDQQFGWTPLYRAVISSQVEATRLLLRKGAEPNLSNSTGESPIHAAVENANHKLTSILLEFQADPNKSQNNGNTALHLAANKGDKRIIQLLLRNGAYPNITNQQGRSALHLAVESGSYQTTQVLLNCGANANLKDNDNLLPIDLCTSPDIQDLLEFKSNLNNFSQISYKSDNRFNETGSSQDMLSGIESKSFNPYRRKNSMQRLRGVDNLNISSDGHYQNRIQTFDQFLSRYKKQEGDDIRQRRDRSLSGLSPFAKRMTGTPMRVFPDRSRSIDMITDPYERNKPVTQESGVNIDLREQGTPFQYGRHSKTQIQTSVTTMTPQGLPKAPPARLGVSSNSFTISPRYLGRQSPEIGQDKLLGTLDCVDAGGRLKTTRSIMETQDDVRIESAKKHSPRQKLVVRKIQEVTDVGNRIHEAMAYQTMKAVEFLSGNQEFTDILHGSTGSSQFKFDDVTRGAKLSNLLHQVNQEEEKVEDASSPINQVESGHKYKVGTITDDGVKEKVKEEVKLELQFSPAFETNEEEPNPAQGTLEPGLEDILADNSYEGQEEGDQDYIPKVLSVSNLKIDVESASGAPDLTQANPDNTLQGYENLLHSDIKQQSSPAPGSQTPDKRLSILGQELPVGRALVFNSFGPEEKQQKETEAILEQRNENQSAAFHISSNPSIPSHTASYQNRETNQDYCYETKSEHSRNSEIEDRPAPGMPKAVDSMNNIRSREMEIIKLHSHRMGDLEELEDTPAMGEAANMEFGSMTDEMAQINSENIIREAEDESTIPDHLSSSIGSPGKRTVFSQNHQHETFDPLKQTSQFYESHSRQHKQSLKKCLSSESRSRPPSDLKQSSTSKFSNSVKKPPKAEIRGEFAGFILQHEAPMTPPNDQESSSGTGSHKMKVLSGLSKNGAILEIDGSDVAAQIAELDFKERLNLDETKQEFPVGDLEHAIKSTSVKSSLRKEQPLEAKIELNQRVLRADDETVNYMAEYEMTRDQNDPKIGANQRYPPHQPVESPAMPEMGDPFFNIADSGTGPDLTGSLDPNISAHELEEPLQISEDEVEQEVKEMLGQRQYLQSAGTENNEDLESELIPADECDLPVQQSSIRQARVTEISQPSADQYTDTPIFEPLNFNYSAVESEVRFSFLENLDQNIMHMAQQFKFPQALPHTFETCSDLEEELQFPDMAVFKSQPNDIPLYRKNPVLSGDIGSNEENVMSTGNELQGQSPFYGANEQNEELLQYEEQKLAHGHFKGRGEYNPREQYLMNQGLYPPGNRSDPNVMMMGEAEAEDYEMMIEENQEILEGLPLQQRDGGGHQYGLRPYYEDPQMIETSQGIGVSGVGEVTEVAEEYQDESDEQEEELPEENATQNDLDEALMTQMDSADDEEDQGMDEEENYNPSSEYDEAQQYQESKEEDYVGEELIQDDSEDIENIRHMQNLPQSYEQSDSSYVFNESHLGGGGGGSALGMANMSGFDLLNARQLSQYESARSSHVNQGQGDARGYPTRQAHNDGSEDYKLEMNQAFEQKLMNTLSRRKNQSSAKNYYTTQKAELARAANGSEDQSQLHIALSGLEEWLEKINLPFLAPILVEGGFDDIAALIAQMKSNMPITDEMLKRIGIEKAGHRARILVKLQEEAGILPDVNILSARRNSAFGSQQPGSSGIRKAFEFCTQPSKNQPTMFHIPTLKEWLQSLRLESFHHQFVLSGYENFEFMLLQMNSNNPISDQVLKNEIGIQKLGYRTRIMYKLQQDAYMYRMNKAQEQGRKRGSASSSVYSSQQQQAGQIQTQDNNEESCRCAIF